jgi:hypothetical protein
MPSCPMIVYRAEGGALLVSTAPLTAADCSLTDFGGAQSARPQLYRGISTALAGQRRGYPRMSMGPADCVADSAQGLLVHCAYPLNLLGPNWNSR